METHLSGMYMYLLKMEGKISLKSDNAHHTLDIYHISNKVCMIFVESVRDASRYTVESKRTYVWHLLKQCLEFPDRQVVRREAFNKNIKGNTFSINVEMIFLTRPCDNKYEMAVKNQISIFRQFKYVLRGLFHNWYL